MNDILDYRIFSYIPYYSKWKVIEKINKGWSKDKKFYIENNMNEKFLLRISELSFYDDKRREFESMKEVFKLGINMSKPIDFGTCDNGKYVYSLLSWIEGDSLNEVLKEFPLEKQYKLGIEAGKILKKMHTIEAPIGEENWEEKMVKKLNNHLLRYEKCDFKVKNDEFAIEHINKNLHLLKNRIQKYQHGDFHVGNLIVTPDNKIGVIDFNRYSYGDIYEEFYKMILFSREVSIPFSIGQIDGYFGDNTPKEFFDVLSIYVAHAILFSIAWAIPFGLEDVNGMIKRAELILDDYDNFKVTIPKWFDYDYGKKICGRDI